MPLSASDRESDYYEALQSADEGDPKLLIELMSKNLLRVADRWLRRIKEAEDTESWLADITAPEIGPDLTPVEATATPVDRATTAATTVSHGGCRHPDAHPAGVDGPQRLQGHAHLCGPRARRARGRDARASFCASDRCARVGARHTGGMASQPSHPLSARLFTIAELTVQDAEGDLLDVDPLQLGPGTPASDALAIERGPQPADAHSGGE